MLAIVTMRIITTGIAMRTAKVADGDPNTYSQELSVRAGKKVVVTMAAK